MRSVRRLHPYWRGASVLLIVACQAWALDPLLPTSQYVLDRWGWAQAFPEETITDINQTPDGVLWVANADGLVRFNGSNAVRSSWPESDVMDRSLRRIALDPQGALWGVTVTGSLVRIPAEARRIIADQAARRL